MKYYYINDIVHYKVTRGPCYGTKQRRGRGARTAGMGKWGSVYNFKQLGQERPHEHVTFEQRLEGEGKLATLKAKEQPPPSL